MAKYRYAKPRRRINYKGISIIFVIVAVVGLVFNTTRGYFITKNIKNAETSIEQVEKEKIELQEEIKALEEKTAELEAQAKELEEILWRYEPVIIPDSMK